MYTFSQSKSGTLYPIESLPLFVISWWRKESRNRHSYYWPSSPGILLFQHMKDCSSNLFLAAEVWKNVNFSRLFMKCDIIYINIFNLDTRCETVSNILPIGYLYGNDYILQNIPLITVCTAILDGRWCIFLNIEIDVMILIRRGNWLILYSEVLYYLIVATWRLYASVNLVLISPESR